KIDNPIPTIAIINPTSAITGGPAFTLTVNGTNFVSGSTVQWNGSARTTTFGSATQLTAAITAVDIASPGTAAVSVLNPPPGGGASPGVLFFAITPPGYPKPLITAVSPGNVAVGSKGFELTVVGSNFVSGSYIQWNGTTRATTFVSSMLLRGVIPG